MQLSPAFSLPENEAVARAIELAYDRDFTHIPCVSFHVMHGADRCGRCDAKVISCSVLTSKGRRPLGYIDVPTLKAKWEAGEVNPVGLESGSYTAEPDDHTQTDPVSVAMTKFKRSALHQYTLITPSTPLGELEAFLKVNIFALGEAYKILGNEYLNDPQSVTDYDRQFVLAVATSSDLEVRRNPSIS